MVDKYITSLQNPVVKHLVKLRIDSSYRYENKALVLEGIKPIQEVAPFVKKLFHTESAPLLSLPAVERWIVTDSVMKKISGMTSPEGVLAEVRMPSFNALKNSRFIVAFDGVNDPGNLGTLLRTALALGWDGAYILPNSCDPFNEKTLRAARGAHFRLPLRMGTSEELKNLLLENHLQALAADLEGQSPEDLPKQNKRLLVLGNEAQGISADVQKFCTKVTLPMPGKMESLNVAIAGGILMYELRKQVKNDS